MGGLDDYIDSLSNTDIAQKVLDYAKKYPVLNNSDKLNSLVAAFNIHHAVSNHSVFLNLGGLHDYIFSEPKDTLINWALACEKYDREQSNQFLIGGLDDYIHSLNNAAIAQIILNYAEKYPVLNSSTELNTLVTKYGIDQ